MASTPTIHQEPLQQQRATHLRPAAAAAAALLCVAAALQGCGGGGDSPAPAPAPAAVPTVRLRNGVHMPVLSAGTWQYDDKTAEASVVAAIKAGFTHIDTAYDYGNQRGVASGLKKSGVSREKLFITTKVPGCGLQNVSAVSVKKCGNDTAARLRQDLELLDVKYIDLLLVHFPPCPGLDGSAQSPSQSTCFQGKTGCSDPKSCDLIREQWGVLSRAYHQGLLKAIGVSNYCQQCLTCLAGMPGVNDSNVSMMPLVNQVQYHVGMGPDPEGFKSFAAASGVVLQAWSPLGHSGSGDPALLKGNLTTAIGKKYGKSPAQVALKWILANGVALTTKSSKQAHLEENLKLFDFELDEKDMKALDAAEFAKEDTPSFLCSDAALQAPARPAAAAAAAAQWQAVV